MGIIAGTAQNGPYIISKSRAEKPSEICDKNVWSAIESSPGTIILGSRYSGLSLLKDGKVTCIPSSSLREITLLEKDLSGRIWVGTALNGLYSWPIDSSKWLNRQKGLSGNTIRAIICDSAPKYIGSWDGGLDSRTEGGWKHDTAIPPPVTSLAISPEGLLFVGTWGHGLYIAESGGWRIIKASKAGLPDGHIIDIKFDSIGSVYLATNKGVARYSYKRDIF
ncbi:MAG: hypothetical protein JNL74_03225 [Fibrobacteres bacterium]|nr:hypothetical protein [Fibrobacterota bacterium]